MCFTTIIVYYFVLFATFSKKNKTKLLAEVVLITLKVHQSGVGDQIPVL